MTTTLPATVAGTIMRACLQCSGPLVPTARSHARYCGAACRKRASRAAPVDDSESVTAAHPCPPTADPVSRFLGRLPGLLAHLADEPPGYIESTHTGRTFPRTYAEHGLPLPDYLRALRD